jgi:hypothetical protein
VLGLSIGELDGFAVDGDDVPGLLRLQLDHLERDRLGDQGRGDCKKNGVNGVA